MDDLPVHDHRKDDGKGKRGGRSGRGGRGGGGRGGGGPPNREYTVSKALSWILRHGAEKEGLKLDGEGFANVEELVSYLSYACVIAWWRSESREMHNSRSTWTGKPLRYLLTKT